jgi:hypothetical protein
MHIFYPGDAFAGFTDCAVMDMLARTHGKFLADQPRNW